MSLSLLKVSHISSSLLQLLLLLLLLITIMLGCWQLVTGSRDVIDLNLANIDTTSKMAEQVSSECESVAASVTSGNTHSYIGNCRLHRRQLPESHRSECWQRKGSVHGTVVAGRNNSLKRKCSLPTVLFTGLLYCIKLHHFHTKKLKNISRRVTDPVLELAKKLRTYICQKCTKLRLFRTKSWTFFSGEAVSPPRP